METDVKQFLFSLVLVRSRARTNSLFNILLFFFLSLFSYLVDVTTYTQQHQQNRLSLEEMGNVLLDAMQGTLICLDNHHIIIEVSKSIKHYFGFEQVCCLLHCYHH